MLLGSSYFTNKQQISLFAPLRPAKTLMNRATCNFKENWDYPGSHRRCRRQRVEKDAWPLGKFLYNVHAHQVLLTLILVFWMRTWAWGKSWRKGSEFVVHSAAIVHTWLVGDENQVLQNSTFSPNLSPAVYFLVSREKNLLYVIRLTQKVMKTTLEGVRHFVIKDQFAADFWRW